jgi:hypothetical protein
MLRSSAQHIKFRISHVAISPGFAPRTACPGYTAMSIPKTDEGNRIDTSVRLVMISMPLVNFHSHTKYVIFFASLTSKTQKESVCTMEMYTEIAIQEPR